MVLNNREEILCATVLLFQILDLILFLSDLAETGANKTQLLPPSVRTFFVRIFQSGANMNSNLNLEIQMRRRSHLTGTLLEVLSGERRGTENERKKLLALSSKLKGKIFVEAVYLLTRKQIKDSETAHELFERILFHRKSMVDMLKREVSIQVAALDYFQSVNKFLKKPIIVEADQYSEFTSRAMIDSMTKTFDRAMLDSDINAEIAKSKRFGTIFSVLFIDLDNLKNINDTWGHESGTNAIKLVVECIRKRIRKYDSIYRYGGDEFIVKLPGTALLQAYNSAQRILNLVNETGNRNFPFTPTVSIGISSFDNRAIKSVDDLLNFADKALYQAKQEGRNTIRAYGFSQSPLVNPLPHQAGLR
jgi:diguanylate cyclase (GGDEF)-like protein